VIQLPRSLAAVPRHARSLLGVSITILGDTPI
jgi:hypothetical protein